MNEQKKQEIFAAYSKGTHVWGKLFSAIILVLLIGAPFLMGSILGALPDLGAVGKAFLSVGLVWLASSVVEFLVYTPILGAGGTYLAFITGNLIKSGTPENEIVSTLSIAASSLVTILVLAIGVLLLAPLQPVLQSPVLQPAFDTVVPALFGAMAYKYYRKNIRIALVPLVVMALLFVLVPSLLSSTSFMIMPSGAMAIGIAWFLYKKKKA